MLVLILQNKKWKLCVIVVCLKLRCMELRSLTLSFLWHRVLCHPACLHPSPQLVLISAASEMGIYHLLEVPPVSLTTVNKLN